MRAFYFGLALCSAGCSVASVDLAPSPISENTCNGNSDCGGGVCSEGRCLAGSGDLHTFLFQVTPSAGDASGVGVQLKTVSNPPGLVSLQLDPLVTVEGRITASQLGCVPTFLDSPGGMPRDPAADSSVPAQVTLTPNAQVLGVYSTPVVVQTDWDGTDKRYTFRASVPPGDYDIYVEPAPQPGDSKCVFPPQLVRKVGVRLNSLTIDASLPSTFQLEVDWPPQNDTLDGWYVDMLDPASGRVLSNLAPLVLPGMPGPTNHYLASLVFAPVAGVGPSQPGQELIRIQRIPPDCTPANSPAASCLNPTTPTLLMARSALSVFSPASGTLTQFTKLPTPVHVEAQVTQLGLASSTPAHVALIAKQVDGIDPGLFAAFTRQTDTKPDGTFAVDLLPGSYSVYAAPNADYAVGAQCASNDAAHCLAQAKQTWDVAALPETQGGRVVELTSGIAAFGTVADFTGHPLVGAQVQALASPAPLAADVLLQSLGNSQSLFTPRASSSLVDGAGSFKLWADPGTFDLSVRPQAGTGFAWLVRPGVLVDAESYQTGFSLKTMQMPLPIAYSGSIEVKYPGATGAGALVRAYVYLESTPSGMAYTDDPQAAKAALQVAETRADSQGNFEVLIPAKLNAP